MTHVEDCDEKWQGLYGSSTSVHIFMFFRMCSVFLPQVCKSDGQYVPIL